MKVKVRDLNNKDLLKIEQMQIKKLKALYDARPFVTKVWMAMNTKIPFDFISKHWEVITNGK